jgi:hypothetical protein
MKTEQLTLSNMEGLEARVSSIMTDMAQLLEHGEKASIGITISLAKVKDTETLFDIGYRLTPRYPARGRTIIASSDSLGVLSVTETPRQREIFPTVIDGMEQKLKEVGGNG